MSEGDPGFFGHVPRQVGIGVAAKEGHRAGGERVEDERVGFETIPIFVVDLDIHRLHRQRQDGFLRGDEFDAEQHQPAEDRHEAE